LCPTKLKEYLLFYTYRPFKGTVVLSVPQKDGAEDLRKRTVVFILIQKEGTVVFSVLHKKGTAGNYQIRNLIIYALYWIMMELMGWVRCVVHSTNSALLN
jgi:hypothetical protein